MGKITRISSELTVAIGGATSPREVEKIIRWIKSESDYTNRRKERDAFFKSHTPDDVMQMVRDGQIVDASHAFTMDLQYVCPLRYAARMRCIVDTLNGDMLRYALFIKNAAHDSRGAKSTACALYDILSGEGNNVHAMAAISQFSKELGADFRTPEGYTSDMVAKHAWHAMQEIPASFSHIGSKPGASSDDMGDRRGFAVRAVLSMVPDNIKPPFAVISRALTSAGIVVDRHYVRSVFNSANKKQPGKIKLAIPFFPFPRG